MAIQKQVQELTNFDIATARLVFGRALGGGDLGGGLDDHLLVDCTRRDEPDEAETANTKAPCSQILTSPPPALCLAALFAVGILGSAFTTTFSSTGGKTVNVTVAMRKSV